MKKKKKSSKKKADLDAFEKEVTESKAKSTTEGADDDDEDGPAPDGSHLEEFDEAELGDDPFARPDAPVGVDAGNEPWLKSDRDYTYPEVRDPTYACLWITALTSTVSQLLTRFYASLHAANPSLLSSASKKRYTIAPPQLFREGNKKSIFANVTDICKKMHRQVCSDCFVCFPAHDIPPARTRYCFLVCRNGYHGKCGWCWSAGH